MKKILSIILFFIAFAASGQISLTNTTHTLELTTSSTSAIDYVVEYFDETTSGAGIQSTSIGEITTATTTTILSAPASSTTRKVAGITVSNIGSDANTITIKIDVSGTEYNVLTTLILKSGESIYFSNTEGWLRSPALTTTTTGLTKSFAKTGTASDATSYFYGYWKDAGSSSGAWAPGTPGLSGRTTDGTSATDAGCLYFPDAAAGKTRYLTGASIQATIVGAYALYDVLWVNSGVVVTTTTGQTINSVTLPARDANGTTNGEGVIIGLYATAALGNAALVSNSTVTYTNSQGVGSRTATLSTVNPANIPATPVIGTVVWFNLQAGDTGVQSIQTLTLNTTLTSGSLSLFLARPIVEMGVPIINVGIEKTINGGNGVPLYDNACLHLFAQTSATTATAVQGSVTTIEK